jgi:hypothetical protein
MVLIIISLSGILIYIFRKQFLTEKEKKPLLVIKHKLDDTYELN